MARKKNVCCPGIEDLFIPSFFKALGDSNRIRILVQLARCQEPCSVSELSTCCPVDFSVVSRHLSKLHAAGIVKSERRGKQVYYSAKISDLVIKLRSMADTLEDAIREGNKSEVTKL